MHGVTGGRWRLVVSDLDGTLVPGTALDHLTAWLGHAHVLRDLEAKFAGGAVTDREVAEAYAPQYAGIALADAADAMSNIASIDDIASGARLLQQRGVDGVIATVSWSFAARSLAELWGFAHAGGADLQVDAATGLFTGRVARHFEPADKVSFVEEHCRKGGFGMDQVVAIGDGRSDLPLFEAAGFSVALNASAAARAAASVAVEETSFVAALRAVPGLLDERRV